MTEEGNIQIQEETSRSPEYMHFLFSSVIKQWKSVLWASQSFPDAKKIIIIIKNIKKKSNVYVIFIL